MNRCKKSIVRSGAFVGGLALVATGIGSAYASNTGWVTTAQTVSKKAQFSGGHAWFSRDDNHGGFGVRGHLYDLSKNGKSVKFQVKVHGYSPTVYNAPTDKGKAIPEKVHYDGSMRIVYDAQIQTCQRNTLKDDCTSWRNYYNPYR